MVLTRKYKVLSWSPRSHMDWFPLFSPHLPLAHQHTDLHFQNTSTLLPLLSGTFRMHILLSRTLYALPSFTWLTPVHAKRKCCFIAWFLPEPGWAPCLSSLALSTTVIQYGPVMTCSALGSLTDLQEDKDFTLLMTLSAVPTVVSGMK